MKWKTILKGAAIAIILLVVVMAGKNFAVGSATSSEVNTPTRSTIAQTGEYQEATLKMINYEYVLEPDTLVKDVPVRMTVDTDTVYGCMRDVVISAFDVRQYVSPKDNVIEFTPDKTGTIPVICSMNMGRGSFKVVEGDGSVNEADQKEIEEASKGFEPVGGSCGGSGGGCGCGA